MAPIEWKPQYSVGDPAVDHEHRELVDLVNAASAAILEGRADVEVDRHLGDLMRAISAHFAHEEKQMQVFGYDEFDSHKIDHERLLDALRDIMDGMQQSAPDAEKMTCLLEAWFTEHFKTHDARLHRQLGHLLD